MLTTIQRQHNILMDYGLPICYYSKQMEKKTVVVETRLGENM